MLSVSITVASQLHGAQLARRSSEFKSALDGHLLESHCFERAEASISIGYLLHTPFNVLAATTSETGSA